MRASRRYRSRRSGVHQPRASSTPPPQRLLDDLSSFQRTLFTRPQVRELADAIREGSEPAGSRSAAHGAPAAGQGRLRARLHTVSRRNRSILGAGPGSAFSGHSHAVSAPGRQGHTCAVRISGCPDRLARNARTYEISFRAGRDDAQDQLRSRTGTADGIRRRPCAAGRLEQVDVPAASWIARRPRISTTTAQRPSKTSSITTWRSLPSCGFSRRPARRRHLPRRPMACTSIGRLCQRSGKRCSPSAQAVTQRQASS